MMDPSSPDPFSETSGIRVNSHFKRTVSLLSHEQGKVTYKFSVGPL